MRLLWVFVEEITGNISLFGGSYFDAKKAQGKRWEHGEVYLAGFPFALENLEKWEKFFQSEKSRGIFKFYHKIREFCRSQGN